MTCYVVGGRWVSFVCDSHGKVGPPQMDQLDAPYPLYHSLTQTIGQAHFRAFCLSIICDIVFHARSGRVDVRGGCLSLSRKVVSTDRGRCRSRGGLFEIV